MTFEQILPHLLESEGGLVDDPVDPGGLTKFGISQRAYPYIDIAALTPADAGRIYRRDYWDRVRANELPAGLRYHVVDMAINAGRSRAVRMLQALAGVKVDGILGPVTLAAARSVTTDQYAAARKQYYVDLVARRPPLRRFLNGWLNRVDSVSRLTRRLLAQ